MVEKQDICAVCSCRASSGLRPSFMLMNECTLEVNVVCVCGCRMDERNDKMVRDQLLYKYIQITKKTTMQ